MIGAICAATLLSSACGSDPDEAGPTLAFSNLSDGANTAADGVSGSGDDVEAPDTGATLDVEASSDGGESAADAAQGQDALIATSDVEGSEDAGVAADTESPKDSVQLDVISSDSVGPDTASADTASADTASADAPKPDSATTDGVLLDAAAPDAVAADTAVSDVGGKDSGSQDTAQPDAGGKDSASQDTGSGCIAKPEVCDGLDNDCDGAIDEDGGSLCDDNKACTLDTCAGKSGCTHKATPVVSPCFDGVTVAGRCYRAFQKAIKWADAEKGCKGWGGHLASISSKTENATVLQRATATCGPTIYWIGLNDLKTEGAYQWTDGTPFTHTQWAPAEPNNFFEEDVVSAYPDGKWNDIDKNDTRTCFVCERASPTQCSDGNACTYGDACEKSGACVGSKLSCNDANTCTTDSCSKKSGCEHKSLKDGSKCGGSGACKAGVCVIGTSDQPAKSCLAILQAKSGVKTGMYWLDPDGAGPASKYKAWCDMSFAGGGWTLVMKLNGQKTTFSYTAALWTNTATYNPGSADLALSEAKLASFWSVPFSAMRLGMRVGGQTKWITVPFKASNLRSALVSGKPKATKVGRDTWKSLIPYSSLQKNCNQEGFNVGQITSRVRIGIVGNGEKDCKTPDSRLGFGGAGGSCYQDTKNSCGNTVQCGGDYGGRNTKGFGFILVR